MTSPIVEVIGPVVLAVAINAFLYGIVFLQFIQYITTDLRDSYSNQLLVYWVFGLDTAHTLSTVYMLWFYIVSNFSNPGVLASVPWPYIATPIFIVCTSGPVQHFFAFRIRQLSRSWPLFVGLAILSNVSSGFGLANAISGFVNSANVQSFHKLVPLVDTWLTLATACDGLIAMLLLYYLNKSRTGFKRTDTIITRIIHSCVETSLLNSLICLTDLIIFTKFQNTNYNVLLALPMGRVYSSTLLAMLNSRMATREELGVEFSSIHTLHTARFDNRGRFDFSAAARRAEVKVAVEEQIQVDPYQRSSSRSSIKGGAESDTAYSIQETDHKAAVAIA
ncbi:hypothetical protein CERSUDRAFT_126979 [Gelatoporia subvermispora B]|uniref:DUF6534 domain-containing protein n=1 Tax=Ceriporiopsis subvermispora (strain B) TaxID=914234 RepID=M2Q5H6_CERS8|nr:hypothetical protein CERSUDRAFT_126979 [Gelatoporia subvermispora B]